MHEFAARRPCKLRQQKGNQKADNRINGKHPAAVFAALIKKRVVLVRSLKSMIRSHQTVKHPHAEKPEPRKKLDDRELLHRRRHFAKSIENFAEKFADAALFIAHPVKFFH